ncbi:MAG: molybdenum cofactor biosynthesis protein MoaE [Gammaproteobacteria bacterium]|nr:molybdenum cofactor biosynthesis protein MoaE [Gammaproteobacteria bacterium]
MHCRIDHEPLDTHALRHAMIDRRAGGFVVFEGWVRDYNEGREVVALHYEVHDRLAVKEGERVLTEALARYDILDAVCHHRSGDLALTDIAVWVGVTSRHRAAAFDACRYIIDEIKARLPIWKKEFYRDGDSGWVNCVGCAQGHAHAHHAHAPREGQSRG